MQRDPNSVKLVLDGDWTMNGAAERQKLLAGQLVLLLKTEPRLDRLDIHFTELAEMDACGCQLLFVFLEHLKWHGIAANPCCIPPRIEEQIRLLGFDDIFAGSGAAEKEGA